MGGLAPCRDSALTTTESPALFQTIFPSVWRWFQQQSGLSWAGLNRRIGTHPETTRRWTKGRVRPNAQHMMVLRQLSIAWDSVICIPTKTGRAG